MLTALGLLDDRVTRMLSSQPRTRHDSVDPNIRPRPALDALGDRCSSPTRGAGHGSANATAARVLGAARDVGHPVSDLIERLPAADADAAAGARAASIRRALARQVVIAPS